MPDDQLNSVIIQGQLPQQIGGARIDEFPILGENGAEKVIGFLGHRHSLLFVNRLPRDAYNLIPGMPMTALVRTFTDPETGMSIMARIWYDNLTGQLSIAFVMLYGWAVGKGSLLYRIVRT